MRSTLLILVLVGVLHLTGCGWMDADWGRNTDHDPPPGEVPGDPGGVRDEIDMG